MIEVVRTSCKLGFLIGCLIIALPFSHSHEGEDHGTPSSTVGSLGPVVLDEQIQQELGIKTEEVGLRTIEERVEAFGSVEAKPENIFWASTRISGRAVRVYFNAGNAVRKGDILAEVESRQVAETPTRVPVKSLITGTVTERNISVGQPVEPNSVLFRVMNLQTVYIRLDIYEADAAKIKIGQVARIYPESFPKKSFEGHTVLIGGAMDEMDRTLPVWVELPNPSKRLRPGMRVRAEIVADASTDVVAVPREAILGTSGNLFVFLDKGDYFLGQLVGVGRRDRKYIEITEGILPGDLVVTSGSYQLQFEAAASSSSTKSSAGPPVTDGAKPLEPEGAQPEPSIDVPAGAGVRLSPLAQGNLGIRIQEIHFRTLDWIVRCLGLFEPVPANIHHVSTRIAGRVTRVYVTEGQEVRKGQTVAEIESLQVANPPPIIKARSTLSGVVLQRHVFAGEPVEPNKSLFTIARLDELLVKCHVYEADLPALQVGQAARIYVEAFPGKLFEGRLEYFDGQIDGETRTLLAYVRVKNPEGALRPNMRAEVHFIAGTRGESIAVPLSAVLHPKTDNPFVFVQTGDFFKRQSVVLGGRDDRYYEIPDGLLPGDRVVVQGVRGLEFATDSPIPPEPEAPATLVSGAP